MYSFHISSSNWIPLGCIKVKANEEGFEGQGGVMRTGPGWNGVREGS